MGEDKLEFGVSLKMDNNSWKQEWEKLATEIQKEIDSKEFKIKIQGIEGLEKIKQQLKEIEAIQKQSIGKLTQYRAGQLANQKEVAMWKANADQIYRNAIANEKLTRQKIQTARAQASLANSTNVATGAIRNQTRAYQSQLGVMNGMKQFINSYVSILGAMRILTNIKDITSEFELQRVSLRAITQDAAFADSLFARIKTTATESPFSTKDLVTYTKQLAAYRIENKELYGTMNMLADVSAGLGVSMDRLILAYGQVKAASVLRGTELRQFTEAGIPLVDELAKKFSQLRGEVVSTGEVFDLISTRQVPFEMVADIFKDMTDEGGRFYEMQKKQAESLYGVFENLKDNIQISFDEIGRSQRGMLMGVGQGLTFLAKNLSAVLSAITPLVAAFGAYKVGMMLSGREAKSLALSNALLVKAEASITATIARRNAVQTSAFLLMRKARAAHDYYAVSLIKASTANNVFSRSLYRLQAAFLANPITAIITILTTAVAGLYSFLTGYNDKLSSVEGANERAAETFESIKKAVEADYNLKGVDELVKKYKDLDSVVKSSKGTYEDFKKIYPELAKEYDNEVKWKEAMINADEEQIEIIKQLQAAKNGHFTALNAEKSSMADLTEEHRRYKLAIQEAEKERLMADKRRLQARQDEIKGEMSSLFYLSANSPLTPLGSFKSFFGIEPSKQADIRGLQHEIESLDQIISQLTDDIDNAKDSMINWRAEYRRLVEKGIGNDSLSKMEFTDAIDKTRKAWSGAVEKLAEYNKTLDELQRKKQTDKVKEDIKSLTKLRDTYQDIKVGAEDYAKAYNFSLIEPKKGGGSTDLTKPIKDQLTLVETIYKRYQSLLGLMSDGSAKAKIESIYGNLENYGDDFLSPEKYKQRLEELAEAAAKLGDKSLEQKIRLKIQDVDLSQAKVKLEDALKEISNQISRTNAATDFFEKMVGLTGDTELATKLTLSVTGVDLAQSGTDVRASLAQQLAEILSMDAIRTDVTTEFNLKGDWKTDDLQQAIALGKVSVAQIQSLVDNITDKDMQSQLQSALNQFIDFDKAQMQELFKLIEGYASFDEKKQALMDKRSADEFKVLNMIKPPEIDQAEWDKYIKQALEAIERKYNEEVAGLSLDEFNKKFSKELSNLDAITVATVEQIQSELQGILSKGDLTPTDMKSVMDILEKLRDIKIDKQPIEEFRKAWKALMKAMKDGDKAGQTEALSNMEDALENLLGKAQEIENALNTLIDAGVGVAESLGVAFSEEGQEAIKAFKDGVSLVTSALTAMLAVLDLVKSGLWPILVASLALGGIFALFSWFSGAKVRAANREIERQEEILKNLERAYKRLEEVQQDLVGSDWVRNQRQQMLNLQKQITALEAQLRAERSKGKKADSDAIEDYKDQILDAQEQLRNAQREVVKEMAGTDLASAAKDFAQSWLDAYLSFDDTMGALRDSFKDTMKSLVQNSMMAKLVQKRLEPVFDAIDRAFDDATLTPTEWQSIMDMGNKAIEYIDEDLTHLAEMLGLREQLGDTTGSNLMGIAKGVAQASEETVLTLAGYANSLLYNQIGMKADLSAIRALLEGGSGTVDAATGDEGGLNNSQLIALQQQSIAHLQAINANTGRSAVSLENIESKLDSVISAQGTAARKVINTRLSS